MLFARMAVKFGWTRDEYLSITPVERAFILKEIESQTVQESELVKQAVELAIANTHRKKGKRYLKLWNRLRQAVVPSPISDEEAHALSAALQDLFKKRGSPF